MGSGSDEARVLSGTDSRELWVLPLLSVCRHGEKTVSPSQAQCSPQESAGLLDFQSPKL